VVAKRDCNLTSGGKKMKLRKLVSATLLAVAASTSAQAAFTFDPTGTAGATGDISGIGIIDQAPGSAWSPTAVSAVQSFDAGGSGNFTLYYQANLSTLLGSDTSFKFGNGQGGNYFTFVAGFGETVLTTSSNSATFGLDASNPVNFFTMYATNALANNLTGTGFATGTPILQAHIASVTSSNFTVQVPVTNTVALDQGGGNGDQWSGQQTISGSGSTDLVLVIDSLNSLYFPDLDPLQNILFSFFNTSQVDPFNQVDPSKCFNTKTGTCDALTGLASVGTLGDVNGVSGPGFIFQADANQSIKVPEPGSMALLGLGLFLVGIRKARNRV
jgi:hypothetical protein